MNDETFGPVIPVMRVGNDEEAIRYVHSRTKLSGRWESHVIAFALQKRFTT